MAIEKKPEQVTISGDIITNPDGIRSPDANEVAITVDVLGARSGRKSSGGKPGRKPKSTSGSGGGTARAAIIDGVQRKLGRRIDEKTMRTSNMGGTGSPGFTGTPPSAAS